MHLKHLICLLLLFVCFTKTYAQWDAQISQYWRVRPFFNPSFAAEADSLQLTALHRQQWIGLAGAPKTSIVTANMPISFLERKHGIGAMFMTESIGLFKNSYFAGQYAYKKKIKKSMLNIGAQVSLATINFDAGSIYIPDNSNDHDNSDPAIPSTTEAASVFDASIGVSWINADYYAGLSVAHLLEPTFDIDDTHTSYISRTYYLTAGYNIKFRNPLYVLQPSVLVKSDGVFMQYDVTARMVYNNLFNGGVSWRKDDGLIFVLGITFRNFDAGYAYDLSTSAISKASSGSHELFLRYNMPVNLDKPKKNRHKSVRVL
ncbi:MAG: type IX secretion system membrane protein PorP/SprF [Dysgonomonas sp.]